ncbi:MAG: bile acid:sodium symporter family protein [Immundisolibacteraceae bacterium]|nr:bile acid:sodium symporter family protein [Immundisolibacteraceae bacterium]
MNRAQSAAWGPLLLLIILSTAAWLVPGQFASLKSGIVPALGLIMFGMGVGLSTEQLLGVVKSPRFLLIGVVLQFLLMPLLAWGIATAMGLPLLLAAGLIITGSCPGGTASNVMVYLAGGNLALSVAMTTCSTLIAPLVTPLLAQFYIGERLELPVGQMYLSIVQIVVLPVAAGMALRGWLPQVGERLLRVMPWVAMTLVALIVATIVGLNKERLVDIGGWLLLAVALHNAGGLLLGYLGSWLLGANESDRRTVALEVGMQNSGLATALAIKFLAPAAALPAALFSLWHNLSALTWIALRPGLSPADSEPPA